MSSAWEKILKEHHLIDILDEDNYEDYLSEINNLEDEIEEILALLNQEINANQNENRNAVYEGIKLPSINIPIFSSSYLNWVSFYDTFTQMIHNQKKLSNIEKMHYLKSHLSNALKLIQHLNISDANYTAA